jgi:hypothetical protein
MTSIPPRPDGDGSLSTPDAAARSEGVRQPVEPAGEAASDKGLAAEIAAAHENERWLRRQFEQEHRVLLAMMRLLVSGVGSEGRLMRFWRWLIDDYRSARRMLEGPPPPSESERALIRRIVAWFRREGGEPESGGDTPVSGRAS